MGRLIIALRVNIYLHYNVVQCDACHTIISIVFTKFFRLFFFVTMFHENETRVQMSEYQSFIERSSLLIYLPTTRLKYSYCYTRTCWLEVKQTNGLHFEQLVVHLKLFHFFFSLVQLRIGSLSFFLHTEMWLNPPMNENERNER